MTRKQVPLNRYWRLPALLRFLDNTELEIEQALTLQRKHFSGLGTDKPTMLAPRTRQLVSSAENFIIKCIGLDGDPEDYVVPRYVVYTPPPA